MSWESRKFPFRSISLSFFANLIDIISTGWKWGKAPSGLTYLGDADSLIWRDQSTRSPKLKVETRLGLISPTEVRHSNGSLARRKNGTSYRVLASRPTEWKSPQESSRSLQRISHPNRSSVTCIAAIPWFINWSTVSATESGNRSATQTIRARPPVSATTSAEAL